MNNNLLLYTFLAGLFIFSCTTLGAAFVFFFKGKVKPILSKISLGFAAGIMISASVWSLLMPAIENAEENYSIPMLPVALGFAFGVVFLIILDKLTPHMHIGSKDKEGPLTSLGKDKLLFLAVTIHNIPEGMAVGVAFAFANITGTPESFMAASSLAIGIGIQNIPEGTAISLPLYSNGFTRFKAFMYGTLSGIVEPIAAMTVVLFATFINTYMPWFLAFAAGAMMYVVVEELIPEAHLGEHSDAGTIAVMSGFLLMMILDLTLG